VRKDFLTKLNKLQKKIKAHIANPSQPYTLPSCSKSPPQEPKLVKGYGSPIARKEKGAANLKEK
jgi:hypothetical protein